MTNRFQEIVVKAQNADLSTTEMIKMEMQRIEAAKALSKEIFPGVHFPEVARQQVFFGRGQAAFKVPDKVAITDISDRENPRLFSIASTDYNLQLHEEIIATAVSAAEEMPEYGKPEFKVSLPYGGARMRLQVIFPEVKYEVRRNDGINPKIEVTSSYDLGWKVTCNFGAFQLVCTNGLVIGKRFSKYQNKHVSTLSMERMKGSIHEGMKAFSEETGIWKKWAEKKLDEMLYGALWEDLSGDGKPFSSAEKEKIEALPQTGTGLLLPDALQREELTLWDLHSNVTQFATHNIQSEVRAAEIGQRIAEVFDTNWRRMSR